MSSDVETLPYRPCVGIMLLNRQNRVFVGRRASGGSEHVADGFQWQMPQGGINEGEEPIAAARRELYEETGVRSTSLLAEAPEWFRYDIPRALVGEVWKGRYRGQVQKWFALRFVGEESEIDIAAPAGHEPEFDAWRWVPMGDLPGLVIPFKRAVYEGVVAVFRHLENDSWAGA
jgi:putative (di)nucleoside polyphosphate hydrolase